MDLTRGRFVHPVTKAHLYPNARGDLCEDVYLHRIVFPNLNGSYDFVLDKNSDGERAHYDEVYKRGPERSYTLSVEALKGMWDAEPELHALLASLGHMKGRAVLVLGNGFSLKELYFLILGAHCVISDLSFSAIERSKELFESSELSGTYCREIQYHAVDALNLPFGDQSFDIIYGYAFVHHLGDIKRFFSEVARCLRPGGICRFLDDGYSPIWQLAKRTVLRPLQAYLHRRTGISPQDLAATRKGGYTRDEARRIMEKHGFDHMVFVRKCFFEYLLRRARAKLQMGECLLKVMPLLRVLDELLERRTAFMETQGLRLIWGFNKPGKGSL